MAELTELEQAQLLQAQELQRVQRQERGSQRAAGVNRQILGDQRVPIEKVQSRQQRPVRKFNEETGQPEFAPEDEAVMLSGMDPESKRMALTIAGALAPLPTPQRIAAIGSLGNALVSLAARSGAPGAVAGSALSETFDPSEDVPSALGRMGIEAGTAMAAQKFGDVAFGAVKKGFAPAAGAMEEGAERAIALVKSLGGRMRPDKLSTSFSVDLLGSVAEASIIGGGAMRRSTEETVNLVKNAADDFADSFVRVSSMEDVGVLIGEAIEGGEAAFKATAQAKYDVIDTMLANLPVGDPRLGMVRTVVRTSTPNNAPGSVRAVVVDLLDKAKKRLKSTESVSVKNLEDVLEKIDAEGTGVMSWGDAQELRSSLLSVGREQGEVRAKESAQKVARALDDAMDSAAKELSGDAHAAWREANKIWSEGKEFYNSRLIRGLAKRDPEAVYDGVVKNRRPGTIRKVREMVGPENWGAVQGHYLKELMIKSQSDLPGSLDGGKMLRQMKSLGGEAFEELFPDATQRASLQDIALTLRLAQKQSSVGSLRLFIPGAQGAAIIGLASGVGSAPAATVLVGPPLLAKMMTRPNVSKWLTTGFRAPAGSKEGIEAATKILTFLGREDLINTVKEATQ